jgi:hypothetical protein
VVSALGVGLAVTSIVVWSQYQPARCNASRPQPQPGQTHVCHETDFTDTFWAGVGLSSLSVAALSVGLGLIIAWFQDIAEVQGWANDPALP